MRNLSKSLHVILICTILLIGHLHSNTISFPEETEELELQIYEKYEVQDSQSPSFSGDDAILVGTVLMVIAVPIAPVAILYSYVWANSLAADQPDSGTRNSYTAEDAAATTDSGDYNTLISIRWQHAEDDLNWAFVVFKLSVGDQTYDCATGDSEECLISQDGNDDSLWATDEFLLISENGFDIADGPTNIDLYVTYRGTAVAGTSSVTVS